MTTLSFPEARTLPSSSADPSTSRTPALTMLRVAAPKVELEHFLCLAPPNDDAVLWAPPGERAYAGFGSAWTVQARGAERFAEIEQQAGRVLAGLQMLPAEPTLSGDALLPRLFGGFAFQPGRSESTLWQGFGDALFLLPRVGYRIHDGEAWLELIAPPSSEARDRLRHEASRLVQRLTQLASLPDNGATATRRVRQRAERRDDERRDDEPANDMDDWERRVRSLCDGIAANHFRKVVTARRATLKLDPKPDWLELLGRLRREAVRCTRFALRRGSTTFVGATPERLVKKAGNVVETEAMAGSMSSSDDACERRLLESTKDRTEHELVVQAIVESLGPICRRLSHPTQPEVRRLRHVVHLRTPITAELLQRQHVLELTRRLHPTPAVGGLPREAALDWIATHEPDERGWYAGPFGWFDDNGDGELVVALRSGLIVDHDVHLFAGAGIVQDSDPRSEYAETELKLAGMLSALGVD